MKRLRISGLILAAATLSGGAGTFSNNFDTGQVPPDTAVYGNTVVEATGGVNNSGVLKLTKAINSQTAGFVINDFDAGATVYGFDAEFDILLGPGNPPADGMSFCFGTLPDGTWGENGPGNCLAFVFQLYPYGGDDANKPNINVVMNGNKFVTRKFTVTGENGILTYPDFARVHIRVNADGSFSMDFKGQTIFTNLFIPNYTPTPGRFGFGGRTGGANANQFIDNLQITTDLLPKVGISQQPMSQKVLTGRPAVLEARITNPENVSLQWFKGATAVAGANTEVLTIPVVSAADAGTYRLVATGPNNVATSADATLAVVGLTLPATPQVSWNFDDGMQPADTTLVGSAIVNPVGGVNGSGSILLTPAFNDQSGTLIINDLNAGAPVYGFTARFDATAGGGTIPPADGFAFAFGTDIPDSPTGEFEAGGGLGSGLRVTFDIYNNDGVSGVVSPVEGQQPAPSIDVRLGNQVLGTAKLPLSFLETPLEVYGETIIQLNSDATLNVVYRGVLVFDKLPIPGFVSYSGGRFALAARTGGLNANIALDNLQLTTDTTPGALRIAAQPVSQTVLVSRPATFTVAVNDPTGTTYQWLRGGTPIAGATDPSYTLAAPVLADSAATFKVQATKGANVVTSDEVSLTVLDLTAPTAPTLALNFNDGAVPANTAVAGSASVVPSGGVGDSGMLILTPNENSLAGSFIIQPLLAGAEVSALWASFDVHISEGSGLPADGLSFNFAPDVSTSGSGPEPSFAGLSVIFDTYNNGAGEAPAIEVRWKGQTVSSTKVPWSAIDTGPGFRTVLVRVSPAGVLDFAYGDRVLANGLQLPNYSFITGGKFGFFANTGGENESHWVDNINIQATKSSAPLGIASQPVDIGVLEGRTATFSVQLTDPVGATYQWSKNGAPISGATQASYTTPPTTFADNTATFMVHAVGPGGVVDSRAAALTVIQPITIANPQVSFDFNDGAVPLLPPPNESIPTIVNGTAGGGYVDVAGGVDGSGVLKLTDAVNGQGGTFIVPDFNNGQSVNAFTAYFAVLVGGGTETPADGFSFVWANDLPDNVVFSENGSGSGLTVGFDIYRNTDEAPSFNIFYKGAPVATKMVDISALLTGDAFEDVYIRLNPEGTVDVQYKGEVIFNKVAVPGISAMSGARFAWGGRTGGLNANQWVDNIKLATTVGQSQVPIGWSTSENELRLTWGEGWKLQSTTTLGNPNSWQDVPNAASPFTAQMTGPGTFYRLVSTP